MTIAKEEKVKIKKKIIIEALKDLLENNVYSKITVQDIADASNFSKGGVLHYFATKEDIYLTLIEDIFKDLEESHRSIFDWNLNKESMAPMASLVGVENFLMDKKNTKIVINLILYAFQEEKIMNVIRTFISKQRNFYESIIPVEEHDETRRKSDIDSKYLARIAQTVVLFLGLLETIDPVNIDHVDMVKFVTTLLKG